MYKVAMGTTDLVLIIGLWPSISALPQGPLVPIVLSCPASPHPIGFPLKYLLNPSMFLHLHCQFSSPAYLHPSSCPTSSILALLTCLFHDTVSQSAAAAVTGHHRLDGLTSRNFSLFWRLGAWDQGSSVVGFQWWLELQHSNLGGYKHADHNTLAQW